MRQSVHTVLGRIVVSSRVKEVVLSFTEKAAEGAWSIEEATAKFQRTAEGSYWRAEIKEGVDFVEDIFKGKNYEETPGEYTEYVARYDLTYVSPCCFETRCKVN